MSPEPIPAVGVATVLEMTVVFRTNAFVTLTAAAVLVRLRAPGEVEAKTAVNADAGNSVKDSVITALNHAFTSHWLYPSDLPSARQTQAGSCAAPTSVRQTDRAIHKFLRFGMAVRLKVVQACSTTAMIGPVMCLLLAS